ncbi:uncharacterized protein [Cicer arietinum]|nr:LOB domain-containing protein 22-like isoform X2 [Cicer arietinum]
MNNNNHNNNHNNNSRNGNGTTQACAACKYQRRKCGPTCILAPYFPHDRQQQFLNAHKLFGVGKITNMIKNVPPNLRGATMSTIMYQSDLRALDPVGGCYGQIQQLQSQIEFFNSELLFTLQQLALFRGQVHNNNANRHHHHHPQYGIINNNIIPQPAQVLNQSQQHQHYADEMSMSQPQQQQLHDDVNNLNLNPNYVPLQEDLNTWVDSIPLSPLTLQDNRKEEEDEQEQEQ